MIHLSLLFPSDTIWTDVTHLVKAESYTQEEQIINDDLHSVIDTASCKLVYDQLLVGKFLNLGAGRRSLPDLTRVLAPCFMDMLLLALNTKVVSSRRISPWSCEIILGGLIERYVRISNTLHLLMILEVYWSIV